MKKPNLERRAVVQAQYLAGLSIRAIASELGISFQAVQAMLKRMNIPRRPRGGNQSNHSRHRK
jgi:transposase